MNIVKSIKHFIRLYNQRLVIGGRFHLFDKQMPIQDDYDASIAFVETYCQHCPAIKGLGEVEDGNYYLLKPFWSFIKLTNDFVWMLKNRYGFFKSLKIYVQELRHSIKNRKYYLNPKIHDEYGERFFLYKND